MKFRLTIGENNTPWGKQRVICEADAENAIEFAKQAFSAFTPNDQLRFKNCWIDAGTDTLPIAVANLIF